MDSPTVNLTTTRITRKILKNDDKKNQSGIDDFPAEETTRFRKRVSFSSRIQIKTIDGANPDDDLKNDSITVFNTNENQKATSKQAMMIANELNRFNDITNNDQIENKEGIQDRKKRKAVSVSVAENKNRCEEHSVLMFDSDKSKFDFNDSEIMDTDESQKENIMQESFTNHDPLSSEVDFEHPTLYECTINKSKLDFDYPTMLNRTVEENLADKTASNTLNATVSNVDMQNRTYNVTPNLHNSILNVSNLKDKGLINQTVTLNRTMPIEDIHNKTYNLTLQNSNLNVSNLKDKSLINHTVTLNQTANLEEKSNRTFNISKNTIHNNSTNPSLCMQHRQENHNETGNRSVINHTVNETCNNTLNYSILNRPVEQLFNIEFLNLNDKPLDTKELKEKLKEKLISRIKKTRENNLKFQEDIKNLKAKEEKLKSRVENRIKSFENDQLKKQQLIEELHAVNNLEDLSTEEIAEFYTWNQKEHDKVKADLKDYISKNKNNHKEHNNSTKKLSELKNRIKNDYDKLKQTQMEQGEQNKFRKLYEEIFSDRNIEYKIVSFERDSIYLSFFLDLIQLEIGASSFLNDLNAKQFSDPSNDFKKHQAFLNYPIEKLYCTSMIDADGYLMNGYSQNRYNDDIISKLNCKVIPDYARFCVNLILGEVGEGNLMLINKRYQYIKDLQLAITHLNLASKFATNLYNDFEYLNAKFKSRPMKFDLKNFSVTLILPSLEDCCFFKLILNILPGCYYQQAVPFKIEKYDPDNTDIFEPNVQKISKMLENQYFENGSLRNYLKKFNI